MKSTDKARRRLATGLAAVAAVAVVPGFAEAQNNTAVDLAGAFKQSVAERLGRVIGFLVSDYHAFEGPADDRLRAQIVAFINRLLEENQGVVLRRSITSTTVFYHRGEIDQGIKRGEIVEARGKTGEEVVVGVAADIRKTYEDLARKALGESAAAEKLQRYTDWIIGLLLHQNLAVYDPVASRDGKLDVRVNSMFRLFRLGQVRTYTCESLSEFMVLLAYYLGFPDGVVGVIHPTKDHAGNQYPDQNRIGHSVVMVRLPNSNAVIYDQGYSYPFEQWEFEAINAMTGKMEKVTHGQLQSRTEMRGISHAELESDKKAEEAIAMVNRTWPEIRKNVADNLDAVNFNELMKLLMAAQGYADSGLVRRGGYAAARAASTGNVALYNVGAVLYSYLQKRPNIEFVRLAYAYLADSTKLGEVEFRNSSGQIMATGKTMVANFKQMADEAGTAIAGEKKALKIDDASVYSLEINKIIAAHNELKARYSRLVKDMAEGKYQKDMDQFGRDISRLASDADSLLKKYPELSRASKELYESILQIRDEARLAAPAKSGSYRERHPVEEVGASIKPPAATKG